MELSRDNATGLFASLDCGHPECTGNHSNKGPWSEQCPGARERHNARRRAQREAGTYELPGENEVLVPKGYCVAWLCNNPTDELACAEHKDDFTYDPQGRVQWLTAEDLAQKEHMTPEEWGRFRRRQAQRRRRAERGRERSGTSERRDEILELLARNGSMQTARLAQELGIDARNVMRYLKDMAEDGALERFHGGARAKAA